MNGQNITVRLRVNVLRGIQIELEGKMENMLRLMEDEYALGELADRIKASVRYLTGLSNQLQIPLIDTNQPLSQILLQLFSTPWGNKPRSFREISNALSYLGLQVEKSTLSGVLVWLTKKGKLKRYKSNEGIWLYCLPEAVKNE